MSTKAIQLLEISDMLTVEALAQVAAGSLQRADSIEGLNLLGEEPIYYAVSGFRPPLGSGKGS